jgi:hypothetical protein
MCVASHLANRALYLVFLHLFANFKIPPAESRSDEFGEDEKSVDFDPIRGVVEVNGLVAEPRHLKLRFVPRNEKDLVQGLNKS